MEQLLYKLVHFDSDGYTYGCDEAVGVYSTFELADAAMKRWLENYKYNVRKEEDGKFWLDKYSYLEIEIFTVDQDWF